MRIGIVAALAIASLGLPGRGACAAFNAVPGDAAGASHARGVAPIASNLGAASQLIPSVSGGVATWSPGVVQLAAVSPALGALPAAGLISAPIQAALAMPAAMASADTPLSQVVRQAQANVGEVAQDLSHGVSQEGVARTAGRLFDEKDALDIATQRQAMDRVAENPGGTVHVAFYSQSWDENPRITAIEFYDQRTLVDILNGKKVVYVTARPISEQLKRHIIQSHPDPEKARKNIFFVSLDDDSLDFPEGGETNFLSKKFLKRQDKIEEVKKIAGHDQLVLVPYRVTDYELQAAAAVGHPGAVWGMHPSLQSLGTKTGMLDVLNEAQRLLRAETGYGEDWEMVIPDGEGGIYSEDHLIDAMNGIWERNPDVKRLMVKLNDTTSGVGNAKLVLPARPETAEERKAVLRSLLADMKFYGPGMDWAKYHDLLVRSGAVVEVFEEGLEPDSLSVQGAIRPSRDVEPISTHIQILKDGVTFMGLKFPAPAPYRPMLHAIVRAVGKVLADRGVYGLYALDCSVRRIRMPDGRVRLQFVVHDLNIRAGGATHPMMAAMNLTGAHYDVESGRLLRPGPNGVWIPVEYESNDHDIRRNLIGLPDERFWAFFNRPEFKDLVFNPKTKSGVVFHLTEAIRLTGNVGYTIIGGNEREIAGFKSRIARALNRLEIEFKTERRIQVFREFVAHDVRENPRLREMLGERGMEIAFDEFLRRHHGILFDPARGHGVVFHPTGYTIIARNNRERDRLRGVARRLLDQFLREQYKIAAALRWNELGANVAVRGFNIGPAENEDAARINRFVVRQRQPFVREHTPHLVPDDSGSLDDDLVDVNKSYDRNRGELLVIKDKAGEIVGTGALFRISKNVAEIRKVYLAPSLQGKGMGRMMVASLIAEAGARGYTEIVLETVETMGKAIKLYEQFGFTRYEPKEYHHPVTAQIGISYRLNL